MLPSTVHASGSCASRCSRYALYWLGALIIFSQLLYWRLLTDARHPLSTLLNSPASSALSDDLTPSPAASPSASTRPSSPLSSPTAASPFHSPSEPHPAESPFENHVFVYQKRWREAIAEAKAGGPAGELFLFDTAERALRHLQLTQPHLRLHVHKLQNRTELETALAEVQRLRTSALSSPSERPHRLLGLYTQTFDLIEEGGGVYAHAAIDPCVYRWLDFWGTPPEQNGIRHHLRQFLTPYDYSYNMHLGFIVDPPPPPSTPAAEAAYEPRICLWGKVAKYFPADRFAALSHVLDHLPPSITRPTVHATIAPPVPAAPAWLVNHGVQSSSAAFHAYLDACTLLVGMGDPVLGPTVFQAIAHGVVYVNYRYSQPKKFWMNGRMMHSSQHDESVRMMAAAGQSHWVRSAMWEGQGGAEVLTQAVAEELGTAEERWKEWKKGGEKGHWKEGFTLPVHALDSVSERVRDNLFDPDICPWLAHDVKAP